MGLMSPSVLKGGHLLRREERLRRVRHELYITQPLLLLQLRELDEMGQDPIKEHLEGPVRAQGVLDAICPDPAERVSI